MIDETIRIRLLRDFGVAENSTVFSPDELTEIWDELNGVTNAFNRRRAALAVMFERTLNSAVKLHDYTAGETGEKLSQVVANLEKRYAEYKPYLVDALATKKLTVAFVGLRARPRDGRQGPYA